MYRPIRFVMVAALVAGLAGPALAQDPDDEWRDDDRRDGRQEERWRDENRDDARYDRRYDDRWRGDRDRGYRDRGGAGAVSSWRIRQARQELRRIQWQAMRDGVITRWERLRIQQARQRLAWLMHRAHGRRYL